MSNHKRSATDRALTFTAPSPACFACYDTGLITNGDGLLNDHVPDYDTSPLGIRRGGTDCAIVCHCIAAYASQDQDGKPTRGGFRLDSGDVRLVSTEQGDRRIGADAPKAVMAELHRRRLESWAATARAMNDARNARRTNPAAPIPWFIEAIRDYVGDIATNTTSQRLQPLGAILGTKPTPQPPRLQAPQLPPLLTAAITRIVALPPFHDHAALIRRTITDRHATTPEATSQLITQVEALADSVADDHPNPHLLLNHLLGIDTAQAPKPHTEAPRSPRRAPAAPAPVSPTQPTPAWPF
jgi:hypothetical protein